MSLQTALVSPGDEPPSSPLQEGEVTRIRARVLEMGLGDDQGTIQTDATPRERELFDMVLRLTNPHFPASDASQLVRQAETIAALVHQRDYLSDQLQEERSRWEGEKMGWERVSEALVVQQQALRPADSDLRKKCENLEFDNKSLKSQLDRSQNRIAAIEHEIDKLKPNLLMHYFVPKAKTTNAEASTSTLSPQQQPSPPGDSPPPASAAKPPTLHALAQASTYLSALTYPSPQTVAINLGRRKKMTSNLKKTLPSSTAEPSSDSLTTLRPLPFPTPPPSARTILHAQKEHQTYFRNTRSHSKQKNRGQPPYPALAISDARAEHLLIAARRIGRERAGIVAGVMSAVEREKEREREQRNGGDGDGGSAAKSYYRESISAPVRQRKESKGKEKEIKEGRGKKNGVGTEKADRKGKGKVKEVLTLGLDSLVNAALQDGAGETSASTGTRAMTRRRTASSSANVHSVDPISEEPASKRRRVSGPGPSTRVRSALDVLADQASVVSSSSGSGPGSAGNDGNAIASTSNEPVAPIPKRRPGRPRKIQNQSQSQPDAVVDVNAVAPTPLPVLTTPMEGVQVQETVERNGDAVSADGAQSLADAINNAMRPAVTPKKKRGRPRKEVAPPPEKDDVESQDEPEEEEDKRSPVSALAPVEAETLPVIAETPQAVSQPAVVAEPEPPIVVAEPAAPLNSLNDLDAFDDVDADGEPDADADGEPDPDIDMEGIAVL